MVYYLIMLTYRFIQDFRRNQAVLIECHGALLASVVVESRHGDGRCKVFPQSLGSIFQALGLGTAVEVQRSHAVQLRIPVRFLINGAEL